MRAREAIVIGVALFIVGLQAVVDLALFLLFTVAPATTAGTAAGAAACGKACAVVGGVVGAVGDVIPFTHGIASAALAPVGFVIGSVIAICISLTFGLGLVLLLIHFNMFYTKYVFAGGVSEILPVFDVLPGWTAMAIACCVRKRKEELLRSVTGQAKKSEPATPAQSQKTRYAI
jgi:hypothetical protein